MALLHIPHNVYLGCSNPAEFLSGRSDKLFLNESGYFLPMRHQCNLGIGGVASVREHQELLFIEFMCEQLDSHVFVD